MADYADKVVAITGAGSGMGHELARRVARSGAKLALGDIDARHVDKLASELREQGTEVIVSHFDVAAQVGMTIFADHTFDTYGQVDYMFSNAGVISVGAIWAEPLADWDWLFGVNTMGAVHAIRAFIPRMMKQNSQSHFITTASIASLLTVENSPAYVASKFASLALTEVLELQLQDAGAPVMAHAVCPAIVKTDLMHCAEHRQPGSFDQDDPYYRSEDFAHRAGGAAAEMEAVGIPVEQAVSTILEGVEQGTFYILTHPQYNPAIVGRAQGIVGGVRPTKVAR